MKGRKIAFTLLFGGILLLVAAWVHLAFPPAAEAQTVTQQPVEVGQVAPNAPSLADTPAPQLSDREMEALLQRKLELREQTATPAENTLPSPPGLPLVRGRETQVAVPADAQVLGDPSLFVVGRNNLNTNANSSNGSTLVEPAAANSAKHIFSAGNTRHAEFSTDGGLTYTNVPIPGGPTDAPIALGDTDVIIDDARRVTFWSQLYVNSTVSNGVIRIFVRSNIPTAACSFDIDPGGTANNILPDYPHIGLTKRFLYLTIHAIPTSGGGFARIYRFNMDQLANCVTTSFTAFTQPFTTFGQRVWTPGEGTNNLETMYWGQLDNSTTFRIFSWPEAAAAPTSVTRAITASPFNDPDCRGGTNNTDYIGALNASGRGFQLRTTAAPGALGGPGVLASYWQVGTDAVHPQGHIHAAVFRLSDLVLISQPHIFSSAFCFGFPQVTANKRGDIGITLAVGGRAGGGGTAARGYVGLDDEFTSGVGAFGTVFLTANGTHNRSDGRYGDYFTIHPYEPCEKWFTATNYSLLNGTAVSNVNSRYVEFGRNQSVRCYRAHRDQVPAAQ